MTAALPERTPETRASDRSARKDYQDPRLAWLSERQLSSRRIRNLQITSIVLFGACLALIGLIAWMSAQARVVPYIVEVDQLGQAVAFAPAERLEQVDDRLITYQLSVWIHHLRTVTPDAGIQRRYLRHAYTLTRDNAALFVQRHFDTDNPFERAQRHRVEAKVRSILPVGESLWQIQWTEVVTSLRGTLVEEKRWQAVVSVRLDPPRDTSSLLENPLGLYVTEIDWTETL